MAEKRYEREIDELLRRLEGEHREPLPFRPRRRPPAWQHAGQRLTDALAVGSLVEWLLAGALGLLVLSFLLRLTGVVGATYLALLAVICFFGALAISVARGINGQHRRPDYSAYGHPGGRYARGADWDALLQQVRQWLARFRR